MQDKVNLHFPEGAIAVIHVGEREWMFEYPRLQWEVMEEFDLALEYWRAGDFPTAEAIYRRLISDYPEFIDVHHHLALLLSVTGREEEAFQVWQEVIAEALGCFPDAFQMGLDLLQWLFLENRPFLRAYQGLGLEFLARGETLSALEIFRNMLAMNPGDNQGVRALVIDCLFCLNRPMDVIAVCDQFPDDGMEHVLYGRVLALYQLGRKDEARQALGEAAEFLPLIAQELVKTRHRKPRDLHPDYVTHGGADQAYYYWIDQGTHWKRAPGAREFVRAYLKME